MSLKHLRFVLSGLVLFPFVAQSQTQTVALPSHPGAMVLDLTGFKVIQSSAKPSGAEIGLRVHDQGNTVALLFLFLASKEPRGNAAACRQGELDQVQKSTGPNFKGVSLNPNGKDDQATATMLVSGKNGQSLYSFHGSTDQCLSIEMYSDPGTKLDLDKASAFLARQKYDSAYVPASSDKFMYAEILYRNQQYKASAPIYADYLQSIPNDKSHQTQRRVATDEMGMALGMSGDVDGARKVFMEAIKIDPDYPLNYYNLACADAEEGNAKDAKLHLQQAFAHKANVILGEHLPDPTKDDSILKLKKDKDFWVFVQTLK